MSLLELIAQRSFVDPPRFSLPDLLAEQALAKLTPAETAAVRDMIVQYFAAELLSPNPLAGIDYAAKLQDHGISRQKILEDYIPAAARYLGWCWEEDVLSFAQVTAGSGQLMKVTRDLAAQVDYTAMIPQHRQRALLLRAPGEDHVLGLLLTAHRLRSRGWLVALDLSGAVDAVARHADDPGFDLVGFSSARPDPGVGLVRAMEMTESHYPNARLIMGGRTAEQGADLSWAPDGMIAVHPDTSIDDVITTYFSDEPEPGIGISVDNQTATNRGQQALS